MIKKIDIPITNKVLSESDILQFANKLYERYKIDRNHKRLSLELKILDGSSYELEDGNPIELVQILKTKKVIAINFDYYHFDNSSSVSLRLNESQKWNNYVAIRSSNSAWFSWVEAALKEILSDIQPQTNFIIKNKKILFHISCLYIGFFVIQLIDFLFRNTKPVENPSGWVVAFRNFVDQNKFLFWLAVAYVNGLFWTSLLYGQLDKIWPSIEFDFGPEYMKKAKIRRKAIWVLLTVFIVPLLLQLLFLKG